IGDRHFDAEGPGSRARIAADVTDRAFNLLPADKAHMCRIAGLDVAKLALGYLALCQYGIEIEDRRDVGARLYSTAEIDIHLVYDPIERCTQNVTIKFGLGRLELRACGGQCGQDVVELQARKAAALCETTRCVGFRFALREQLTRSFDRGFLALRFKL